MPLAVHRLLSADAVEGLAQVHVQLDGAHVGLEGNAAEELADHGSGGRPTPRHGPALRVPHERRMRGRDGALQ